MGITSRCSVHYCVHMYGRSAKANDDMWILAIINIRRGVSPCYGRFIATNDIEIRNTLPIMLRPSIYDILIDDAR
jgi:hypothetical protein